MRNILKQNRSMVNPMGVQSLNLRIPRVRLN